MIDRARLIEIFLEVAKIEGLSCNERGVADYIRDFMKPLGVSVEEDDTANITGGNSGNLICKVGSGGSFVAHELSHDVGDFGGDLCQLGARVVWRGVSGSGSDCKSCADRGDARLVANMAWPV